MINYSISNTQEVTYQQAKNKAFFLELFGDSLDNWYDIYDDIMHNPKNAGLRTEILAFDFIIEDYCKDIQDMYEAWVLYINKLDFPSEYIELYYMVFGVILYTEIDTTNKALLHRKEWP